MMKKIFTSIVLMATVLSASARNQLFYRYMFEQGTADESIVGRGYRDDWGFYTSERGSLKGSFILVDMAILSAVEALDGINCVTVTFKDEGCTNEEEAQKILEQKIKPAVESLINSKKNKAAYVAATLDKRRLEIYAYTFDHEQLEKEIRKNKLIAKIGENMNVSHVIDRNWTIYQKELFPDPWNYQDIQNQRLTEELQSNGDVSSKLHIVSHVLSFPLDSRESAEKFAAKTKTMRFYVDEIEEIDGVIRVTISKKSKTDIETITKVTKDVMDFAKDFGGEYVEWSTRAMKD